MSPVGSTEPSRMITTGPLARRIPTFQAAPVPSRSLVRTTSSPSSSSAGRPASCSADGPSATTTIEVAGGRVRADARQRARHDRPASRSRRRPRSRRPASASSRRDGTAAAGPVPDDPAVLDRGRMRGLEREVGAPVDDLPAGRLDLGPDPVRLLPVLRRPRRRAVVGRRQHLFGDPARASPRHRPGTALRRRCCRRTRAAGRGRGPGGSRGSRRCGTSSGRSPAGSPSRSSASGPSPAAPPGRSAAVSPSSHGSAAAVTALHASSIAAQRRRRRPGRRSPRSR